MKAFLLALFIANCILAVAQVPQKFNYQAIARNSNGSVISNQFISVEISVRDSSSTANIVYQEIDTATTNQFGLFTVAIGAGLVQVGTNLNAVNWASGNKYLEVGFSETGGYVFTPMGTTELLSVPYALYAANSANYGSTWLDYAVYSETEGTGASSQASFTDSAFQTRLLNTTEDFNGTAISRNGNEITLQPGKYHVSAFAQWGFTIPISSITNYQVAIYSANSLLRLADASNNVYLTGQGELEFPQMNVNNYLVPSYSANMEGVINITTTTTLTLQHYFGYAAWGLYSNCNCWKISNSLVTPVGGIPMGVGQNEVYARILIQKVN